MKNKFFTFRRHDILFLKKDAELHQGTSCTDSEKVIIREWISKGRPVIVRRPGITKDGLGINCGIPLPPAEGKKRIAFVASIDSIEKVSSLPSLGECLYIAEKEVSYLFDLCKKNSFPVQAFGSLAWEHLTGLKYLQKTSDIDALFNVRNNTELYRLYTMLEAIPDDIIKVYDIEIILWNGDAFSWREFSSTSRQIMIKNIKDVFLLDKSVLKSSDDKNASVLSEKISYEVTSALYEELQTYPKPGLVSYMDNGSHKDMDAVHFSNSIAALRGYFKKIALAGMETAKMHELRKLGLEAEKNMSIATGGINTHRGAIFTMGLLAAATGYKLKNGSTGTLGEIVKDLWSSDIVKPIQEDKQSHGAIVMQRYGFAGAGEEAAKGFPSVYQHGLPIFKNSLEKQDRNTAKLCSFFSMLENVNDTTLLYRGGINGLEFAKKSATDINRNYAIGTPEWQDKALQMHKAFISRNLSPGGVADLLSAVIFIQRMEELCLD